MSSVEALTERVKQLEQELRECQRRLARGDDTPTKSKGARPKINVLSAEVVDSNPYRLLTYLFTVCLSIHHGGPVHSMTFLAIHKVSP